MNVHPHETPSTCRVASPHPKLLVLLKQALEQADSGAIHWLRLEVLEETVYFGCDIPEGLKNIDILFRDFGHVRECSPELADQWHVIAVRCAEFGALFSELERVAKELAEATAHVRRWGGDHQHLQIPLPQNVTAVLHERPFAGISIACPDTKSLYYLRPDARLDFVHTEHIVKYPLRVALKAGPLLPLHAAACAFGDCGILIAGEKGAGKSTLTMQLMQAGVDFIANDLCYLDAPESAELAVLAFPKIIRLADGTIGDILFLRDWFQKQDFSHNDYRSSAVFNAGKHEFYLHILKQMIGSERFRSYAPVGLVILPEFCPNVTECSITELDRCEDNSDVLDSVLADDGYPDWLGIDGLVTVNGSEQDKISRIRSAIPRIVHMRYGPTVSRPSETVIEFLNRLSQQR